MSADPPIASVLASTPCGKAGNQWRTQPRVSGGISPEGGGRRSRAELRMWMKEPDRGALLSRRSYRRRCEEKHRSILEAMYLLRLMNQCIPRTEFRVRVLSYSTFLGEESEDNAVQKRNVSYSIHPIYS